MLEEFKSVLAQKDKSHIPSLQWHTIFWYIWFAHQWGRSGKAAKRAQSYNKASGPVPRRVLKELAGELAPVVTALFRQTLETGILPIDCTEAIISPVYNKGNVHLASNYRPVSLTCVLSKVMEHIICKHILNHLDTHSTSTVFAKHILVNYCVNYDVAACLRTSNILAWEFLAV